MYAVSQVQIAACDTFRSGAVEQLRTHCNRLNIPLYERGYEKDPARVAFEAIKSAQRSGIDVLLVDTAGGLSASCNGLWHDLDEHHAWHVMQSHHN